MAKKNGTSGAKGKLWVQIMCGLLAGVMVLGILMMLIELLLV